MVTGPLSGEMRGLCHWVLGCLALVSGHTLLSKVFGSLLPFPWTELSLTQSESSPDVPTAQGMTQATSPWRDHMLLSARKEIMSRAPSV